MIGICMIEVMTARPSVALGLSLFEVVDEFAPLLLLLLFLRLACAAAHVVAEMAPSNASNTNAIEYVASSQCLNVLAVVNRRLCQKIVGNV